jgi:hypothetical protein
MSEFILILLFFFHGRTTSQSILFPSQAACENARQVVEKSKLPADSFGVCVPRSAP